LSERLPWAFVTSHATVLIEVTREPDATVRQLAERAGVTERQAHRILADLATEGYIVRERRGRRNHYRVNHTEPMRHPSLSAHRIGELLDALQSQ
jgi:DNA-binding MarR family transcriptional regulator